ncbi:MAG: hypothetical protein JWQ04_3054 [Pedosphaera sp.]|nr:hypothetical protein [Pedosphaera sp.]
MNPSKEPRGDRHKHSEPFGEQYGDDPKTFYETPAIGGPIYRLKYETLS